MKLLYLAHDLDDAAIWRRVQMLEAAGAEVVIAGFKRLPGAPQRPAEILGWTQDGKLAARALSVARAYPQIRRRVRALVSDGVDVILARNLEMLALGRHARAAFADKPALVYELLDIHRIMLGQGTASRALRRIERGLLAETDLIVTSSEAFESQYLEPYQHNTVPVHLVENKPFLPESLIPQSARLAPVTQGQITIGWFGILRCRWSLETLDGLTRRNPGRYRVVISGRPSLDVIPDFHAVIEANDALEFRGSYAWPDDLPEIYGACDLAWLLDRFDPGGNSDWLLPNRLYEGGLFGAPPIGLSHTQIGRRMAREGIGVQVSAPEISAVEDALAPIGPEEFEALRTALAARERASWLASAADGAAMLAALRAPIQSHAA